MNAISPVLGAPDIIRTIENLLVRAGPYSLWTIGLAVDIRQARATRDTSGLWADWETDGQDAASAVLEHFTRQGMMRDSASDEQGIHVYIF